MADLAIAKLCWDHQIPIVSVRREEFLLTHMKQEAGEGLWESFRSVVTHHSAYGALFSKSGFEGQIEACQRLLNDLLADADEQQVLDSGVDLFFVGMKRSSLKLPQSWSRNPRLDYGRFLERYGDFVKGLSDASLGKVFGRLSRSEQLSVREDFSSSLANLSVDGLFLVPDVPLEMKIPDTKITPGAVGAEVLSAIRQRSGTRLLRIAHAVIRKGFKRTLRA